MPSGFPLLPEKVVPFGVESSRAGLFVIPSAPRRLRDPNAGFPGKIKTSSPVTQTRVCCHVSTGNEKWLHLMLAAFFSPYAP